MFDNLKNNWKVYFIWLEKAKLQKACNCSCSIMGIHTATIYSYLYCQYTLVFIKSSGTSGRLVPQLPAQIRVSMKLRLLKACSAKSWKIIQEQRLHNPSWKCALMLNYPQSVWVFFFQFCFGFPFLFIHLEGTSFNLWLLSLILLPGTSTKSFLTSFEETAYKH